MSMYVKMMYNQHVPGDGPARNAPVKSATQT